MAVRLSVIMIQSNPPTAGAQRMAEAVVGQLIGAEGIDLTLIGALSSLAETSTDRLTLESLSGDVAALDWQDPESIVRGLATVNFLAHRAPHPHDDDVPTPALGNRRVFAFDMNRFRSAGELIEALTQLNARRQVRTFAIGPRSLDGDDLNPHPSRQASPPPAAYEEQIVVSPGGLSTGAVSPDVRSPGPTEPPGTGNDVPRSGSKADSTKSGLDLDDLLDQLDQADP